MQEYDGSHGTPFPYEYGYSQGYEVNIQLRRGERLVRNWFNKGLHVNGMLHDGDEPGCLDKASVAGPMAYLKDYGDMTAGRIGSGTLEYDVPLADAVFRGGAWKAENVAVQFEDRQATGPPRQGRTNSRACWKSACPPATSTWPASYP